MYFKQLQIAISKWTITEMDLGVRGNERLKFFIQYVSEFLEFQFSSPDSETETKAILFSRPSPIPRLVRVVSLIPSPRLRRVLSRETRYFDTESPFYPMKSYRFRYQELCETSSPKIFESDSESETQNIKMSSPIPRPSRVLDRETRPFESETRDSGISGFKRTI